MARARAVAVAAVLLLAAVAAGAGGWGEVVAQGIVAAQPSLSAEQALVAAAAARRLGAVDTAERLLEQVLADPELGQLAAVTLAEAVVARDPDRAAALVTPVLARPDSPQLRAAAVTAAAAALRSGVAPQRRAALAARRSSLPTSLARTLAVALAVSAPNGGRAELARLLDATTDDAAALAAAEALLVGAGTARERWLAAQTLFQHGLYDRAEPLLAALHAERPAAVPAVEVAFVRGRCAFRRGRWAEAVEWYERAVAAATGGRRATLLVHLARTHELAGDLAAAVDAARRAVASEGNDDRRLLVARLRLRQGRSDLAAQGVAAMHRGEARERGHLLLALDQLRRRDDAAAATTLAQVKRAPWREAAAVNLAATQLRLGQPGAARATLAAVAPSLDQFWALRAREVMARLGAAELSAWRVTVDQASTAASGRERRRAFAQASRLEVDAAALARLEQTLAADRGLVAPLAPPPFAARAAARLWQVGLEAEAVRWLPAQLPDRDPAARLWTALRCSAAGAPERGIQVADAVARELFPGLDHRLLPPELQRALYPLPRRDLVQAAAAAAGLPWPLLAAVAREESRWDETVVSQVGARGLVQLMPTTAAAVAARLGRPAPAAAELFDPATSLQLGAAELARLLARFAGWPAPAVAAYNAGEAQAQLWLEQCGEGCDTDRYVATISFAATFGYTADVLAAASRYDELYPPAPAARGSTPFTERSGSPPDVGGPPRSSARSRR